MQRGGKPRAVGDAMAGALDAVPRPKAGTRQGPVAASGPLVLPGARRAATGGDGGPRRSDIGYLPHIFMHCGLPRRPRKGASPKYVVRRYVDRLWGPTTIRFIGGSVLVDKTSEELGLPCAGIARPILERLSTAAFKSEGPEIALGESLRAWMEQEFGINDLSGDSRRLFARTFAQVITMTIELTHQREGGRAVTRTIPILEEREKEGDQPWNPYRDPWLANGKPSVRLSGPFLDLILTRSAPVRRGALLKLKASPLASDVYRFLSIQQFALWKRAARVPGVLEWEDVLPRFSGPGDRPDNMKRSVAAALDEVTKLVWPTCGTEARRNGLVMRPSEPHVTPLAPPDAAGRDDEGPART